MAKKKKNRSKRKNQYQAMARRGMPRAASGPAAPRGSSRPRATAAAPEPIAQAQVNLGEEYRYVITDLKNMGILAAAMFGLVAILALILR